MIAKRKITLALTIVLTLTACEEKSKPASAPAESGNTMQSSHTVTFKDKEIPITAFRSPKSDSDCILDSLVFQHNGVKQTIRFQGTERLADYKFDCNEDKVLLEVSDYNFDDYMDIDISVETGADNKDHFIFMYNSQAKKFYHLNEPSTYEAGYIEANDEDKTIKFVTLDAFATRDYHSSRYKWEKGNLVEIYRERKVYDEALGKDIITTETPQNGEWVQKIDTISIGGE